MFQRQLDGDCGCKGPRKIIKILKNTKNRSGLCTDLYDSDDIVGSFTELAHVNIKVLQLIFLRLLQHDLGALTDGIDAS
jgi:hypothetical protein